MKRQKFVYNAHAGDNTKFVYIAKMEQKANFVYKELAKISNSPSRRKGDLNHQKKQGLDSFNEENERKKHEPDCYATRHNGG